MIRDYLVNKRTSLLSFVKDWSDGQDHIRYAKNVNTLSYEEWFWCHPSAYKLIQYGIFVIGFITYLVAGWYLYNYSLWLAALNGFLALVMVYLFFKKHKEMKYIPDFTFYDLYLRDFEVNKNEK